MRRRRRRRRSSHQADAVAPPSLSYHVQVAGAERWTIAEAVSPSLPLGFPRIAPSLRGCCLCPQVVVPPSLPSFYPLLEVAPAQFSVERPQQQGAQQLQQGHQDQLQQAGPVSPPFLLPPPGPPSPLPQICPLSHNQGTRIHHFLLRSPPLYWPQSSLCFQLFQLPPPPPPPSRLSSPSPPSPPFPSSPSSPSSSPSLPSFSAPERAQPTSPRAAIPSNPSLGSSDVLRVSINLGLFLRDNSTSDKVVKGIRCSTDNIFSQH